MPGEHLNVVTGYAGDSCDMYGNCKFCTGNDGYGNCLGYEYKFGTSANCTSGCQTTDNWGYIKPVGLDIIPAGETVFLQGGRNNGGGGQYIRCYLDVLYATEYKP